uniref:GPI mannosyltransferase 2 n=1 Tax=Lygus hesperus TaxID=30085 RepID=A0A146KR70_LYGHE
MSAYKRVLYRVAVTSRLTFLGLSLVANVIIPDHKSDGFVAPDLENVENENLLDRLVWFLFGGLMRWDAQHFLQIARSGYSYHTSFAFFPLFPLAVRSLSVVLQFILGLNVLSGLLLASVLLNSVLFVEATILLYKLSLAVLKHELFAFHSAIFFCLSPATVFFIAPYSESLFAFCTFKGMLNYATNKMVPSVLWFTLSTFVRSNGVINAGYPLHFQWFCIFKICELFSTNRINIGTKLLKSVFLAVISCGMVILPFFLFQTYSYYLLCMRNVVNHSHAMMRFSETQGIPLVGMPAAITCNGSVSLPYFELQSAYWDVGFLRYYKWKQLPNFLLATPIITLVLYYGLKFLSNNKESIVIPKRLYANAGPPMSLGLPPKCLVYMVQAVYLTITCALCINIQVTTRMIASSSPIIYWIASSQFMTKDNSFVVFRSSSFRSTDDIKPSGVVISTYFMSYAILGIILFSNNVPWT